MSFVNNQGTKIFYTVEGQGAPLVMFHGGFGSHEDWLEFGYAEALKETYQLILIDMRGHGQSGKPHEADKYSFRLLVEDIIAVLDELKIDRCHVYGYSMGGWFILGLGIYYPDRLLSIIMSDGFPSSGDPKLLRDLTESLDQFVAAYPDMPIARKERTLNNDRLALFAISDGLADEMPTIIKDINVGIEKINVPILLLISNLEAESEVYQLINKSKDVIPNAKFIHFEDFTHVDIFTNSDRVLPHIKEFLSSI